MAYIVLPNGQYYTVPEGVTNYGAALDAAKSEHPEAFGAVRPPPPPKTGFMSEAGRGLQDIYSNLRTAVSAPFGAAPAAEAGLKRAEEYEKTAAPAADVLKTVQEAYKKDGLGSAIGAGISSIPAVAGQMVPMVGEFMGAAAAGAAVAGPVGAIGAPLALAFAQHYGSNIEQQAAQQKAENKPVDIDSGRALAYAAPEAVLDAVHIPLLGKQVSSKLFGPVLDNLLGRGEKQIAERYAAKTLEQKAAYDAANAAAAQRGVVNNAARGMVTNIAANVPLMVTQTALQRSQMGQSLTDDEAMHQYGSAMLTAILASPIGAYDGYLTSGKARDAVARARAVEAAKAKAIEDAKQAEIAKQQPDVAGPGVQTDMFTGQEMPTGGAQKDLFGNDVAPKQTAPEAQVKADTAQALKEELAQTTDPVKREELQAKLEELAPVDYRRQVRLLEQRLVDIAAEGKTEGKAERVQSLEEQMRQITDPGPVGQRALQKLQTEHAEAVRVLKASTDPMRAVKLGEMHNQTVAALAEAKTLAEKKTPPIDQQIERATAAMQTAKENGDTLAAAKQAKIILDLQAQQGGTPTDLFPQGAAQGVLKPLTDVEQQQFKTGKEQQIDKGRSAIENSQQGTLPGMGLTEHARSLEAAIEKTTDPEQLKALQAEYTKTMQALEESGKSGTEATAGMATETVLRGDLHKGDRVIYNNKLMTVEGVRGDGMGNTWLQLEHNGEPVKANLAADAKVKRVLEKKEEGNAVYNNKVMKVVGTRGDGKGGVLVQLEYQGKTIEVPLADVTLNRPVESREGAAAVPTTVIYDNKVMKVVGTRNNKLLLERDGKVIEADVADVRTNRAEEGRKEAPPASPMNMPGRDPMQREMFGTGTAADLIAAEKDKLQASIENRLDLAGSKIVTASPEVHEAAEIKIDGLRNQVTKPLGNAKQSLLDRMNELYAKINAQWKQWESKLATPTMADNVAKLAARHKGEKYAPRQMTPSERGHFVRSMEATKREYEAIQAKVAKVRDQIIDIGRSLYTVVPAEKASVIEARKQAAVDKLGRERNKMSRESRRAKKINEGDVRNLIVNSETMRDKAQELGAARPEYLAWLKSQEGRSPVDINLEKAAKAIEIGRTTPEFKVAFKEHLLKYREAAAQSKQTQKSQRTVQETRKIGVSKETPRTGSPESLAATNARIEREDFIADQERRQRAFEKGSYARGVEVESPDLTPSQRGHVENNDTVGLMTDLANDTKVSPLNRAVASKLATLLGETSTHAVSGLKDTDGTPAMGKAVSTKIELDAKTGMTQEIVLHEGTHAAVDRVLDMPEHLLNPTQLAAKRELTALFEAAKRDPAITSMNAKSSLKEFVAEVMSNRNLQEQLRGKKWTVSDAFKGFISTILRMVGFTKAETETMLGASIRGVEALMMPSKKSNRSAEREPGVPTSTAIKDIHALDNGSNSMKEFANQFGADYIKQKDQTPADVERIAQRQLDDMFDVINSAAILDNEHMVARMAPNVKTAHESAVVRLSKYIEVPTLETFNFNVRGANGKPFDKNSPLDYITASTEDFAVLKAQTDAKTATDLVKLVKTQRLLNWRALLRELDRSIDEPGFIGDFTTVERALVAKAAGKYSVITDSSGRLKLVTMLADNQHLPAVVSADDAAFVIQKLREGKGLKDAFLEGLQANADRNIKNNLDSGKEGWVKYDQSSTEEAAQALNAGAAGTPWCTGANIAHARSQIKAGDFYIHYKDGRPQVAVRMDGADKIGEVRGTLKNQELSPEQQQLAYDFLISKNFEKADRYIEETKRKQMFTNIADGSKELAPAEVMSLGVIDKIDSDDINKSLKFPLIDGYGGKYRIKPSDTVVEFFKNKLSGAVEKAMEAGYVPTTVYLKKEGNIEYKFNDTQYERPATELVNAGRIYVAYGDTETSALTNLVTVGELTLRNSEAAFPKLMNVGKLVFTKDATVTFPDNARVGSIEPRNTHNKTTDIVVKGATVVDNVLLIDKANSTNVINVHLPDALYVPEKSSVDYMWPIESALSNIETSIKDKTKIGDPKFNKAVITFLENQGVTDTTKQAHQILIGYLHGDIVDALTKDHNATENFNSGYFSKLEAGSILSKHINEFVKTDKDRSDTHSVINLFLKPNNSYRLPEKIGGIDAPNRIADNPPYQMASTVETPSYARAAKYAPGLEKAGALADELFTAERPLSERLKAKATGRTSLEFLTKMVDQYAPLENMSRAMDSLRGTQMMFFARMAQQRSNLLGQVVGHGSLELVKKPRPDGRSEWLYEVKDGPSMVSVNKLLTPANPLTGNAGATIRLFSLDSAAKRAKSVGIDKMNYEGLTKDKLAAAQREIDAIPGLREIFDKAHAEYQKFNENNVKFAVQTGYLSKELAAKMLANKDYVPYYRESDKGEVTLMMGNEEISKVGNIRDQPYLHELVGGNARILDFNTAAVRNANMLLDMGLRNNASKSIANELKDIGMADIRKGKADKREDTFNFKVDGEDFHAIVKGENADLLVKGMEGIPTQINTWLKLMGLPSRLIRTMFVANPISAPRILFKDTISSAMVAGSNLDSIGKSLRSVKDNLMEKRGLSGGEVFQGLPADMANILREVQTGKPGWESLLAKSFVLHAKADALTRQIRYDSYIKQGLSDMEASYMALESMNFTKRGISPSVHVLNTLNPFINSQIQGVNTLIKSIRGTMPFNEKLKIREKIIQRGMLLASATMMYASLMQDDETYKNAKPDQKYNNFFVPFPGLDEKVRIPIPFEAGLLFKSVPEALINYAYGHDKDAAHGLHMAVMRMIPTAETLGIPQALKPAIEAGLGKSFYTGRDLESRHEQSLQPGMRTRDTTSALADTLGQQLNMSPVKIDHLIQGYTGGLGLVITQMASSLVFGKDTSSAAAPNLSQRPLIGSTFQPKDAGEVVDHAYQVMEEAKQVKATYNDLLARGKPDAAAAYLNKNADEFAKSTVATQFTTTMTQFAKDMKGIMVSSMTPEEKRDAIAKLKERRTSYAQTMLDLSERTTRP